MHRKSTNPGSKHTRDAPGAQPPHELTFGNIGGRNHAALNRQGHCRHCRHWIRGPGAAVVLAGFRQGGYWHAFS